MSQAHLTSETGGACLKSSCSTLVHAVFCSLFSRAMNQFCVFEEHAIGWKYMVFVLDHGTYTANSIDPVGRLIAEDDST